MKHKVTLNDYNPVWIKRGDRIATRNRVMVARYYYWTELRRRRFDDVMHILSLEEFFVEDRTICNVLSREGDYLSSLYNRKAGGRDLENKYPSWDLFRKNG